jgi:hypothetical protein
VRDAYSLKLYAMAGRHPAAMRQRDESAHPVVEDAIERGYIDTSRIYPINGFTTHHAANEGRLSINRAGQHLGVSISSWVTDQGGEPCYRQCQDLQAPHGVHFRVWSKNSARQHVYHQSGGDPANLKYNPFAKKKGPAVDDAGRRL